MLQSVVRGIRMVTNWSGEVLQERKCTSAAHVPKAPIFHTASWVEHFYKTQNMQRMKHMYI